MFPKPQTNFYFGDLYRASAFL